MTQKAYGVTIPRAKRGAGGLTFGTTKKEIERMNMLLEVNTYADAAARLGISLDAMKQTMSRVMFRARKAKAFTNEIEYWKRKRREAKAARRRNR